MPESWHLLDTNILLRLGIRDHADYPQIRSTIDRLEERDTPLAYTLQNLTEFWNVATRPLNRNGFGLTVAEADRITRSFEAVFTFLPDNDAVYREWRRLVVLHEVKGVHVHDARLVAVMRVYGIHHLFTLNEADFRRYPDLVLVHPGLIGEPKKGDE
ncbi:MAG: type II toxin-antitoxin system VapC family toxin [Bryobacteraceae bacterium]